VVAFRIYGAIYTVSVRGYGCPVFPDPGSGPFIQKKEIKREMDTKNSGGLKAGMSFDL
jgi:hypothetical protein